MRLLDGDGPAGRWERVGELARLIVVNQERPVLPGAHGDQRGNTIILDHDVVDLEAQLSEGLSQPQTGGAEPVRAEPAGGQRLLR